MRKRCSLRNFFLSGVFVVRLASGAQDDGRILEVVGKGAEGREPYRGGGKVRFVSVSMPASLVHFSSGEQIPAAIEIAYEVIRPAEILLDSRLGSEYWSLYNYSTGALSALHSREGIDLRNRGRNLARAGSMTVNSARGPKLQKGVCGIRGRSYFLIVDAKTDRWRDVVEPNSLWHSPEVKRELTFTLANLTRFELRLGDFTSTWLPGGRFRMRLWVKDADGDTFPIPRARMTALVKGTDGGSATVSLSPLYDFLNAPHGSFEGILPKEVRAPKAVVVRAAVTAETTAGRIVQQVERTFSCSESRVGDVMPVEALQSREPPRTPDGKQVETRAIWVHARDFATPEATKAMIARVKKANLNVVVPIVYVRGCVMFRSDKLPMEEFVPKGFDPLAFLVEKCHAAGLEVHPWFCVAYFGGKGSGGCGPGFRRYPQFAVVGKDGKPFAARDSAVPGDVHNPDYQKFVVDMMLDVAKRYRVDGLHFDYIRTMTDCYCEQCRNGFAKIFEHSIEKATDEEWVRWNQEAVGKIVREVSQQARQVHRGVIVSAAVFSNLVSGARQGQDAPRWADACYLDVILPMDYTMDSLELRKNERDFLDVVKDDSRLATGISLYVRSSQGAMARDASLVLEQISMVRSMGIQGFSFFCYDYLSDAILDMLRQEPFAEPAIPTFRLR